MKDESMSLTKGWMSQNAMAGSEPRIIVISTVQPKPNKRGVGSKSCAPNVTEG